MMNNRNDLYRFSADRPIQSIEEDILGRTEFAESLAKAITAWKNEDSLVIGLFGSWGSGKSSIKNMTIDVIRKDKNDTPLILEFNPWQWAGQKALFESFFREIGNALGKNDKTDEGNKWIGKWRFYSQLLKTGSILVSGFSIIPYILMGLSSLAIVSSFFGSGWFVNSSRIIFFILIFVSAILRWGGRVSKQLSSLLEASLSKKLIGLNEYKNNLKKELTKLKVPLLVIIDDIDRLSRQDTLLLMQLVKTNADFPNIVYLLIFQKDIVENNLSDHNQFGKEYLEKIIQVPFDLPEAEKKSINRVLFKGLDEILFGKENISKRFDRSRWGGIFIEGIDPYFKTLRDVYRYLSTLSFYIKMFEGENSLEVNPIDLVAIEVLRLFEPEVYIEIKNNKMLFTEGDQLIRKEIDTKKIISSILDISGKNRDYVEQILNELFPEIPLAINDFIGGSESYDEWVRDLRICHPQFFDRYFKLSIPQGDLSQSELDEILASTSDENSFKIKMQILKKKELLNIVMERLDSYKDKIPIEHAKSFVPSVMDMTNDFPDGQTGNTGISPFLHAYRIIYWYLKQEPKPEIRGQILQYALEKTNDLTLLGSLISEDEKLREKNRKNTEFLLSDNKFNQLRKRYIEKLEKLIEESPEKLIASNFFKMNLYLWKKWTEPEKARKWVEDYTKDDDNLLLFLHKMITVVYQGFGPSSVKKIKMRLKDIENFMSLNAVISRLGVIEKSKLGQKERQAVMAFENAIKRRDEGKEDDVLFDDD